MLAGMPAAKKPSGNPSTSIAPSDSGISRYTSTVTTQQHENSRMLPRRPITSSSQALATQPHQNAKMITAR